MKTSKSNKYKAIQLLKKAVVIGRTIENQLSSDGISSIGTQRDYQVCIKLYLDWCQTNAIPPGNYGSNLSLSAYLEDKSELYRQKTLCQHRMALNAAYHKQLPRVKSLVDTVLSSRDYRLSEVLLLIKNLHPKNAIAILLCFFSGLRAHELATLQRANEGERSHTRTWSKNLFVLENYFHLYIVTGKGGLRRYVAIPTELAKIIEAHRFESPRKVCDRGIHYHMNYNLGFGKALSQCFTRASLKHFGWSTGLHGLRHSYAKNRIRKLTGNHFSREYAKSIVSQELGHFRPSVINCYMR